MRRVLEELSQVLQADKSWSRTEIFRAGEIIANLPSHIQVIVGGPIFRSMDPEKLDAKDYLVLKDIRHFIDYLLTYSDSR